MKLQPIILKRFKELEEKIEEVEQTRYTGHLHDGVSRNIFEEWANSVLNLLQRVFREESVHFKNFTLVYDRSAGWLAEEFDGCKGIFRAAKSDYEGGYLFKIESLVSAEVIDDVLEQAQHLLDNGYKDPACVIAGVALETTLKKLCDKHSLPKGKLDKMNADLAKAGIYNVGMLKQITAWADRRNNAAHGNWDTYTKEDAG
ncbi:MAG: DUF4145 domain-containing protein, partial [Candidatus Brocadiales bacterium]